MFYVIYSVNARRSWLEFETLEEADSWVQLQKARDRTLNEKCEYSVVVDVA